MSWKLIAQLWVNSLLFWLSSLWFCPPFWPWARLLLGNHGIGVDILNKSCTGHACLSPEPLKAQVHMTLQVSWDGAALNRTQMEPHLEKASPRQHLSLKPKKIRPFWCNFLPCLDVRKIAGRGREDFQPSEVTLCNLDLIYLGFFLWNLLSSGQQNAFSPNMCQTLGK